MRAMLHISGDVNAEPTQLRICNHEIFVRFAGKLTAETKSW